MRVNQSVDILRNRAVKARDGQPSLWATFACANLGLTQACLVAKGPLTWVMVVAAIR